MAVEYSLDKGRNWIVEDEVDNTGLYVWTAPFTNSDTCLVRVRDVDDSAINATSGLFSLAICPVKLAADLNGDCRVDLTDLALLATEWLTAGDTPHPPPNPAK